MKDKINKIRKACIKANPEGFGIIDEQKSYPYMRDVRLADVLLVISNSVHNVYIDADGVFIDYDSVWESGEVKVHDFNWNLKDNNLENQSEETLEFIFNLLKE